MNDARLLVAMILSGALLLNCGKDDKTGAETPAGKVDTSSYKNTVDADGVQKKATEAQKIFSNADEKFSAVAGSKYTVSGLMPRSMLLDYDVDKCKAARVSTATTTSGALTVASYSCEYTDANATTVACTIIETKSATTLKTKVDCDNGTAIETTDVIESGTDTSTTTSTSTSFDYSVLGDFSKGSDDCAGAIANVQKFYANGKTQLEEMLKGLKDKDAFGSAAAGKIKVEEVKDANAAIAYKFSTEAGTKGFTVNGNVSAGANDDLIVFNYDMDMAIDMAVVLSDLPTGTKLPADSAATPGAADPKSMKMAMATKRRMAADLKKQVIDYEDTGTSTINDKSFSWKSLVSVEGGEKPAVTVDMSVTGADPQSAKDVSTKMQVNITVVDANTVQMTGSGIIDGKSQVYSRTLNKGADGQCKVANETP